MIDDDDDDMLEIKLVLLGESGVGKTSIIGRYVRDEFSENIISSSTMTYVGKTITINKQKIQLNIWDTIGQERFRSLSKLFFNDTKIVVLVYSIDSKKTFDNLSYWYDLYREQLVVEDTILGVVANKSDLFDRQEVSDEEGREYAKKNGAIFGLISAKANKQGIDLYIHKLIEAYLNKINKNNNNNNKDNKGVKLNPSNNGNKNNQKSSCCGGGNSKKLQRKMSLIKSNKGIVNSIFLGNNEVGKTSIIKRICGKQFSDDEAHTDTISDFTIKCKYKTDTIILKIFDVDNDKMKTKQFIDTMKNSNIFFLVYDIRNKESLNKISFWIEAIKRCKENEKEPSYLLYILGNKDDSNEEEIKEENTKLVEEGKKISIDNKGIFRVVSAKENKGIDNIVSEAIEKYLCMP
jgi:small GTP-binding protein